MKKENQKFQVQWRDRDSKGYYDTFILTQDRKEAEIYAKTAQVNGCLRIQIIDLTLLPDILKS